MPSPPPILFPNSTSLQHGGQVWPTVAPKAVPAGAEEFTVTGFEAEEGGGATATGALVSGGNIRSCFLTFNFLR